MYAIVIGCGRAGAEVASRMCEQGHSVVVIDRDRAAFRRLSDGFSGTTLLGQAIDEDCLISAGIERAGRRHRHYLRRQLQSHHRPTGP